MPERIIQIKCANGDSYKISEKSAYLSKIFKNTLEEDPNPGDSPECITLNKSDISHSFKFVAKFFEIYQADLTIPEPLPNKSMNDIICDGSEIALKVKQDVIDFLDSIDPEDSVVELEKLIMVADYLDIESLLNLLCAFAAVKLVGKDMDYIFKAFDRNYYNEEYQVILAEKKKEAAIYDNLEEQILEQKKKLEEYRAKCRSEVKLSKSTSPVVAL